MIRNLFIAVCPNCLETFTGDRAKGVACPHCGWSLKGGRSKVEIFNTTGKVPKDEGEKIELINDTLTEKRFLLRGLITVPMCPFGSD